MNKKVIAGLGILIGASGAYAGTQIFSLSGPSTLTISKAALGNEIKKIETRFVDDSFETQRVYKVTARSIYQTGLDGIDEESVIESYGTTKTLFDTKKWTLKVRGVDFKIFNKDFVQTTEDDDDRTLNHVISVTTGRELFTAIDATLVSFEVPNSKLDKRYFAEIVDEKAPQTSGTFKYVGTIGYFDNQKLKGRARIYANLAPYMGTNLYDVKPVLNGKDELQRDRVTLWNADGSNDAKQAYSGVGFGATLNTGKQDEHVTLMLDGDQVSDARSVATPDTKLVIENY